MATLQAFVEHFAEHFTYLGIFIPLLLGSLGVPIPEELPIITAGVLSRQGAVRWWLALSICVLGVLSGDVILYWVGRHWGDRVLNWRVVRRRLTPQRAQWLTEAYRRHAMKTIFMARHIMGLRAAAFLTAGIARVPFRKFIAADAGAALLGVPFGFGLAYCFADRVDAIFADVHRVERWLFLGGLILLVFVLGVTGWRWTRRAENRMLANVDPEGRQGSVPVSPRRGQ